MSGKYDYDVLPCFGSVAYVRTIIEELSKRFLMHVSSVGKEEETVNPEYHIVFSKIYAYLWAFFPNFFIVLNIESV